MLDCPGADAAVRLPEADSMVVTSRGQNDRVAAHRPLVHIHTCPRAATAQGEAWITLKQKRVGCCHFHYCDILNHILSIDIIITSMLLNKSLRLTLAK